MTQSGGGGNSPEDRVGGFSSHKDLLDSVVKWIPLLSKLFFFRHQGKYRAWNTSSTVATGAIQIPSNSSKKGKIKGELSVLLYNILKINKLHIINLLAHSWE